MSVKASRLALCAAGAVMLSGCQLMSSLHLAHGAPRGQADKAAMDEYFTARGRTLLQAGQPGAAIEAFNFALATGEAPAPVYNGLGIAYARIGRPDLAYRFFQKAQMSDPSNPTYAANLDRLVKSPQFTLDMAPRVVRPPAVSAQPAAQAEFSARPDGAAPPSRPGRLQRTAAHQFSLTTLPVDANSAPPQIRRAQTKACSARSGAPQRRDCPASMPATATSAKAPAAGLAAVNPVAGASPPPAAGKRKVVDMRSIPAAEVPADSTRAQDPRNAS